MSIRAGSEPSVDPELAGPVTSSLPPATRRTRRRRRPSGAPPPLPRSIGSTGKGWIVATAVFVVVCLVAIMAPAVRRACEQLDSWMLRGITRTRTDALTDVLSAVNRAAMGWAMFVVAIALVVSMVVFRRWRQLFTFLGSALVVEFVGMGLITALHRPRPFDVTIIGRWQGFAIPSATVGILAFTVVGAIYSVVVPGRPRNIAKWLGIGVIAVVCAARMYLAVDRPTDVLVGLVIGVVVPLNAFRFFTPNEVFPVSYSGGKTAHLDVGGRRGVALRRAVEEQLGVTLLDVTPIGLAGSGGSTPLRLCVAGEPPAYLFGKLYAMNHVRADRWYKLGRLILYGRLEDEAPFHSVRRLVQYEDYALRVMRDAGIPVASPVGIVELTPEREYLLVTEFVEGSEEIGDAEVDDQVIDEGLAIVRRLWDAGLAHRDIKPANLLVKDGHVWVIDVAFAQVRASAWREAIDLANMMLVLAVRTEPERVYQRALLLFTPDEIAEAFAATRGVASPSQLRTAMKHDGRDLVGRFRSLAPPHPPISLQRWGIRRVALAAVTVLLTLFALSNVYSMFTPVDIRVDKAPSCGTGDVMILMAQSVPTARQIPCVSSLPAGWSIGGVDVQRGRSRFWLNSDRAGGRAVRVTMRPAGECPTAGATEIASDAVGMRRYERPQQLPPGLRSMRTYVSPGSCVIYDFQFDGDANASLMVLLDTTLDFQPRAALVEQVQRRFGLSLCGVGAPPCPGGRR